MAGEGGALGCARIFGPAKILQNECNREGAKVAKTDAQSSLASLGRNQTNKHGCTG